MTGKPAQPYPAPPPGPELDVLRRLVRSTMDEAKQLEWSDDIRVQRGATWLWCELDVLFQQMGGFGCGET